MAQRYIMRVDLSTSAKKSFSALHTRFGMTQLSMDSRLIEWFTAQTPSVQLRLMDSQADPAETGRLVLKLMAK